MTGVQALTPSERRVTQLAAEGLTNREIAQALFVSHATVVTHLSHCYQKLDISSREKLAAALEDQREAEVTGHLAIDHKGPHDAPRPTSSKLASV